MQSLHEVLKDLLGNMADHCSISVMDLVDWLQYELCGNKDGTGPDFDFNIGGGMDESGPDFDFELDEGKGDQEGDSKDENGPDFDFELDGKAKY